MRSSADKFFVAFCRRSAISTADFILPFASKNPFDTAPESRRNCPYALDSSSVDAPAPAVFCASWMNPAVMSFELFLTLMPFMARKSMDLPAFSA